MNAPVHPPLDALLAWWLHESDDEATAAVDLHLLGCDACGALVDDIAALRDGLRVAFDAGLVHAFVGRAFIERLVALGKRVRQYRVPADGGVDCGVAPDDDVVVSRLQLPAGTRGRIDAIVRSPLHGELRMDDLPYDPAAGELLSLPSMARLRRAGPHRSEVSLLAVDAAGERLLGRYVFNHRPWSGAAD